MKTVAEKAGFNVKNLTNHGGNICYSSCHKNVQILNGYSTLSERHRTKKKTISTHHDIKKVFPMLWLWIQLNSTGLECTTQRPLTLFQGASIQGETFNISVNALNETPTLSLHSPKSKSTTFCYWIRRCLKPPLHVSGYFWIRNIFISNFRPHSSGEFGSESGHFWIHALQSGEKNPQRIRWPQQNRVQSLIEQ